MIVPWVEVFFVCLALTVGGFVGWTQATKRERAQMWRGFAYLRAVSGTRSISAFDIDMAFNPLMRPERDMLLDEHHAQHQRDTREAE